jgi:hypothetical protein
MPAVSKAEEVEHKIMRLRYMDVPIYEHDAAAEAPGGVLWFKEGRRREQS